jgi:metal-responsive CopG/Arc/MetJ family transcriptional regulator
MIKTSKIAISLPQEDLERIEKIRRKMGLQRSVVIDKAIRFWLKHLDEQDMIKQYEAGYMTNPESVKEIEALEKMSAVAAEEEGWK